MPQLKILLRFFLIPFCFLSTSCVKDVDLEQAREIVIPPTAAVDLVYFTLGLEDFTPANSNGPKLASDVVRLEFLDDDYIQDGLVRADLSFLYTNSFTSPVETEILFLSENNNLQYRISFLIPGGSPEDPETIEYTEIIEGANLEKFKKAIKMQVNLEMYSGPNSVESRLQLKSRAFLKLEF